MPLPARKIPLSHAAADLAESRGLEFLGLTRQGVLGATLALRDPMGAYKHIHAHNVATPDMSSEERDDLIYDRLVDEIGKLDKANVVLKEIVIDLRVDTNYGSSHFEFRARGTDLLDEMLNSIRERIEEVLG